MISSAFIEVYMIYIIVLNFNEWKDTVICLESLLKLDSDSYKIVICDTSSSDESQIMIYQWAIGNYNVEKTTNERINRMISPYFTKPINFVDHKDIKTKKRGLINYIRINKNIGFSGGNNVGIRFAMQDEECERIWLLNNDTVVDSKAMNELVKTFDSDSRVGLACSVLMDFYIPDKVQCIGGRLKMPRYKSVKLCENMILDDVTSESINDIFMLAGASIMFSREFINKIGGGLDESFFLYNEEINLAFQAKKYGFKQTCSLHSLVYHKGGNSTKKVSSPWIVYQSIRGKYIIIKRYYIKYLPITLLYDFIRMIFHFFRRDNIAKSILLGMFNGVRYVGK